MSQDTENFVMGERIQQCVEQDDPLGAPQPGEISIRVGAPFARVHLKDAVNLHAHLRGHVLDLFRKLHEQGTTIIVVTHDALVASCAQREIMLNHGVLVGEKWNDEDARKAYEAAGGKPASTGAQVEGAQNGETAIGFTDPTKAAKTGGEE